MTNDELRMKPVGVYCIRPLLIAQYNLFKPYAIRPYGQPIWKGKGTNIKNTSFVYPLPSHTICNPVLSIVEDSKFSFNSFGIANPKGRKLSIFN